MFEKFLIENWKDVLRYAHSVRAAYLGAAIVGAYDMLPDDAKASLPSWTLSAVAVFALVAVIFVRIVQQPALTEQARGDQNVDSTK
jgi:hypothetical protein